MSELLQHLINGIAAGTIYALVALGYTMVYGVLKLINFAHGDVMMVGAILVWSLYTILGRGLTAPPVTATAAPVRQMMLAAAAATVATAA